MRSSAAVPRTPFFWPGNCCAIPTGRSTPRTSSASTFRGRINTNEQSRKEPSMTTATLNAAQSGTFRLGGDLSVNRLGFGAMRITGNGIWGPPADHEESIAVLRRAIELGVNLIDTAESYGPHVSEELIAEALHPYRRGLVIATKGGLDRPGPHEWEPNGRPERLREEVNGSLKRLRLERIDLWQLHRIDLRVPADEQFGAV